MHNVEFDVKSNKLIITVDVSDPTLKKSPPSSTGKTHLVASTSGAVPVHQVNGKTISFSLNVMHRP